LEAKGMNHPHGKESFSPNRKVRVPAGHLFSVHRHRRQQSYQNTNEGSH